MEVYIWADGSWHCSEDGSLPEWKSDDYYVLEVPDDVDDLEDWVELKILEVNLGVNCERSRSTTIS